MLRKQWMGEARCRTSRIRYYLLEEETAEGGSYGVGVELGDEEAAILDLSPSRQRVEALAELLMQGAVTPVGVRDVVDDWLLA